MVNKEVKNKLLNIYTKKEDKIFVSKIIDDVDKYLSRNILITIGFLDMYEKQIVLSVLNNLNIEYKMFDIIEDISRFVIFLIPDYMKDTDVVYDNISCIKIIPNVKGKLSHKDYMGAIYSLGLKENKIGDIFIQNDICYAFFMKSNEEYILTNLNKVGKNLVKLQKVDIYSDEVLNLHLSYRQINIIVPSLRVDVILGNIYNLSRNEVSNKIEEGSLMINCNQVYFKAQLLNQEDIVSFKKYGKFKFSKIDYFTKNGKIAITIHKYI